MWNKKFPTILSMMRENGRDRKIRESLKSIGSKFITFAHFSSAVATNDFKVIIKK